MVIIFSVADHNIDNIHDVEGQLCDDGDGDDNQDDGDGDDNQDDGDVDDNYIGWW